MPGINPVRQNALALLARATGQAVTMDTRTKKGAPPEPQLKLGPPVTTKPASKFSAKDVQDALEVLAGRAFGIMSENSKVSLDGKDGEQKGSSRSNSSKGTFEALLGLTLERIGETYPEFTDWVKKTIGGLGIKTAQATTSTAAGSTLGAASGAGLYTPAVKDVGFKSVEEMVGNGLFTPAKGQAATSTTSTAASSTLQTAGSIMSGVAGLYSMYEGGSLIANANKVGGLAGRRAGSIGGLTAGLGAGMAINALGFALGPIGWGALLAGALVGGGLIGSRLGDRDRWKTEGKRLGKLLEQGVAIPQEMLGAMQLTRGRSKEELINPSFPRDFVGHTEQGFVNNKFALSRDEKDLHPEDIMGYAAFFEKFGNDWLGKFSAEQRWAIAKVALDSGSVREKHGTINVKWSSELDTTVQSILSASVDGK